MKPCLLEPFDYRVNWQYMERDSLAKINLHNIRHGLLSRLLIDRHSTASEGFINAVCKALLEDMDGGKILVKAPLEVMGSFERSPYWHQFRVETFDGMAKWGYEPDGFMEIGGYRFWFKRCLPCDTSTCENAADPGYRDTEPFRMETKPYKLGSFTITVLPPEYRPWSTRILAWLFPKNFK